MVGDADASIQIVINNKVITHLFDPEEFVFPLIEDKTVNLFLFTCSCGVPGCAGWHDGFHVLTTKDQVIWVNGDPENTDQILEKSIFEREEYEYTQFAVLGMLYTMADKRGRNPRIIDRDDDYGFGVCDFTNTAELIESLECRHRWIRDYHIEK